MVLVLQPLTRGVKLYADSVRGRARAGGQADRENLGRTQLLVEQVLGS